MSIYTKVQRRYDVGYIRDGLFVKGSRVPQEVKERLEITDHMDYDDKPERRRCLFCEAPQTRVRALNVGSGPLMVDLCEYHYYNRNIGQLAQEIREQKEKIDVQQEKSLRSTTKRNKRTKGKDARPNPISTGTPSQG